MSAYCDIMILDRYLENANIHNMTQINNEILYEEQQYVERKINKIQPHAQSSVSERFLRYSLHLANLRTFSYVTLFQEAFGWQYIVAHDRFRRLEC